MRCGSVSIGAKFELLPVDHVVQLCLIRSIFVLVAEFIGVFALVVKDFNLLVYFKREGHQKTMG